MRNSSPNSGPPQWAEPDKYVEVRSAFYSSEWAAAAALESDGGSESGWLSWEQCCVLLGRARDSGYGPPYLRHSGAQGMLQLRYVQGRVCVIRLQRSFLPRHAQDCNSLFIQTGWGKLSLCNTGLHSPTRSGAGACGALVRP